MAERKKLISVDFDGVLHSYESGWCGATETPDPPTAGAIKWLKEMLKAGSPFRIAVFSSRSKTTDGIHAMKKWLEDNGLSEEETSRIRFPMFKPPASVSIDDRAIQFTGSFPTAGALEAFKTWQGR